MVSKFDCEGNVLWFNKKLGYGFALHTDGKHVFIHYTAIEGEGKRYLHKGDKISYNCKGSVLGGWSATKVIKNEC